MDSRTNLPASLTTAIASIEAVEGPFCHCSSGCGECFAEVEHESTSRLWKSMDRVGVRCDCGKRCSGETFIFHGVAYCSLTCVAIAVGEDAGLVCTDDVIAQVSAAIVSYWLALRAERETARDSSAKLTVRPGAVAA